jgi:hypothetical protein
MDSPLDWAIVGLIGATVGIGELVSRYRDEPFATIRTPPSIFYLAVNGAASLAALALIRVFDWKFGATSEDTIRWIQVSVAGFGAMALFRSSLFNVRVGNQDVALGPSTFLSIILDAADREVDRVRARSRARSVDRTMRGVAFTSAHTALPTYCLALMSPPCRGSMSIASPQSGPVGPPRLAVGHLDHHPLISSLLGKAEANRCQFWIRGAFPGCSHSLECFLETPRWSGGQRGITGKPISRYSNADCRGYSSRDTLITSPNSVRPL